MKSIQTLAGDFKKVAELVEYCNKQHETITLILEEKSKLAEEVEHLKNLLQSSLPVLKTEPVEKIRIQDEEMICLMQIQKLKESSMARTLTLEEVKKLDLLHKNLKLARGENTVIVNKARDVQETPERELIEIAASPTDRN